MKRKFPAFNKPIPDLNAYEKSYSVGISLALSKKPLGLKSNPYSKLFRFNSHFSYDLGLKFGYQKGVEVRETSSAYDFMKERRRKSEIKELEAYRQKTKSIDRER